MGIVNKHPEVLQSIQESAMEEQFFINYNNNPEKVIARKTVRFGLAPLPDNKRSLLLSQSSSGDQHRFKRRRSPSPRRGRVYNRASEREPMPRNVRRDPR